MNVEQRRAQSALQLGKTLPKKHKEAIRMGVTRAIDEGRINKDRTRRCDKVQKTKIPRPITADVLESVCSERIDDPNSLGKDYIAEEVQKFRQTRGKRP